jgi:hypothetical protein
MFETTNQFMDDHGWPMTYGYLWFMVIKMVMFFVISGDLQGTHGDVWWLEVICLIIWVVKHFGGSRIWSHRHIGRCGPRDWAYRNFQKGHTGSWPTGNGCFPTKKVIWCNMSVGEPKHTKTIIHTYHQWPFQEPKLEVPTIYKACVRPMEGDIPPKYGLITVPPF